MLGLATIDLILLAALALSAFFGALRGLVRELLSIVIWVVAILGAFRYGSALGDWLNLDGRLAGPAGFAIIFVAVFVAGAWGKKVLAGFVAAVGLGGVDRLLGFLFGAVRGALICLAVLILVRPFIVGQDWWWDSQSRHLLGVVMKELDGWFADPEQSGARRRAAPATGSHSGGPEAPQKDSGGIAP